jgi:hypothetical protein
MNTEKILGMGVQATVELPEELQKDIEAKVAELKATDAKLRVIFPIVVEGEEYDDKEFYVGYFRQPNFQSFSKFMTASQSNSTLAMRTMAKECFMDGDKELVDDDSLFLYGLMGQFARVIQMRHGKLVNLSKPGK